MRLKHCATLAVSVLLMLCLLVTVAADPSEELSVQDTLTKTYSLHISPVQGFIDASPRTPAYWEYPQLKAGEDYTEGTLIIRNDSEHTTSLQLTSVSLPYGNTAALEYLDHLMLTIREGDKVLYQNTYAHINDAEGGFTLSLPEMAPGEEHIYTVDLRCLYSYRGDPAAASTVLNWNFEAKLLRSEVVEKAEGQWPEWVTVALIVGAVTLGVMVLTVLIFVLVWVISFRKKKEKPVGQEKDENTP